MDWFAKLIGDATAARSAGEAASGVLGALGEVIPAPVKDLAAGLPDTQGLRDLAGRIEIPAEQWLDRAQSALDAVPKEAGGFIDQGLALLRNRFKS
jgi:hypothetical protein